MFPIFCFCLVRGMGSIDTSILQALGTISGGENSSALAILLSFLGFEKLRSSLRLSHRRTVSRRPSLNRNFHCAANVR